MASPTAYAPSYDFTQYQAANPTDPLPGNQVDNELYNIATSIAEIINNLNLIQNSDGSIANGAVGPAQLAAGLFIGINTPTTWATLRQYAVNNFVYGPDGNIYQCVIAHASNVFSTDLASGYWVLTVNFAPSLSAAAGSATAAAASATSAASSATAAAASATLLAGTSATSISIATGSHTFTTTAGLAFPVGGYILAASAANPTVNNMYGVVTSYSGTTLIMSASVANGSGTHTDWNLALSGATGATGATGAPGSGTGDMLKANNLSELASFATARSNLGLGTAALQANSFFAQVSNNLSDVASPATAYANIKQAGTTSASGALQLATNTEATTGTNTAKAVTPAGVAAAIAASNRPIMTALGIGSVIMAIITANVAGLNPGDTIAGSSLQTQAGVNSTGGQHGGGDTPSGTWQALQTSVAQIAGGGISLFQRVS